MKIERIYSKEVKKFLEKQYLIKIKDIDYFPLGEDGASYIIKTKRRKYYCKVYNKVPIAYASIGRIKIIMNFLFDAHEKFGFQNAPLPIKNKYRNLISKFKGHPVILYDYIHGKNLKKFSNGDYKKLGRILAKLHLINKNHFPNIKNENLNLEWEKKILKSIKELKNGKFHKDSNCGILKKIILKNENLFLEGVEFLEKKVRYINKKRKNYVISHNDLHWGNLMKDDTKTFIIDWDGLELALPEKDIMFFSKDLIPNKIFWKEYYKNRKHRLDKKALEYYVIRRLFSNITFFSRVILHTRVEKKRFNEYMKEVSESIKYLRKLLKLWGRMK